MTQLSLITRVITIITDLSLINLKDFHYQLCVVTGDSNSLRPYTHLNQMLNTIWIKCCMGLGGVNQIEDYVNAFTPKKKNKYTRIPLA